MTNKDKSIDDIEKQIKKIAESDDELTIISDNSNEQETTSTIDDDITNTKIFNSDEVSENIKVVENDKEEVVSSKSNKKKSKKIAIAVLTLLIIVVTIFLSIFLYKYYDNEVKNNEEIPEEKELTDEERKKIIKSYGEAIESVISVYYSKQGVVLEYGDAVKLVDFNYEVKCKNHEVYNNGKIYLDKCSVNGIISDTSYGEKQEIVESDDEILNVYVNKNNKIATLTKPKNEKDYDKYIVHCGGIYSEPSLLTDYGDYVLYYDSEYRVQMKNYKTDEKFLPNINYQELLPIEVSANTYDTRYLALNVNNFWGIYSINDGGSIITPMYSYFVTNFGYGIGPASSILVVDENLIMAYDGKNYGVINYTNNKTVISFEYRQMMKSGNYIWTIDHNGKGHIFDVNGNSYLTNNYDDIYGIVDGIYVLVKQDDNLKMVQIDGKLLYDYGKVENLGNVNFSVTYEQGALFQFIDKTSEEKCIEIIYNSSEKKGTKKSAVCGGIAKPILYLYPKNTTNVTITFEHPEYLETTYPKYINKWQVTALKDGSLYDKNGKYYYALYWDERKVHSVSFDEGFYVEKDDAISFLEEKLSYIGLNDKEKNEFIMYWLPILEKNKKSLVYFELTEERQGYNKININPEPDSLLRVVIHVKKVDKKINIKKQSLIKLQRKGFVAVEWGGTTY